MADQSGEQPVRSERVGDVGVVYASDYLTKLSGERVERECRRRLEEGCRALVLDFSQTGLVNSIAVSILLGVIDAANRAKAPLVFASVKDQAAQIFELLGLTRHVRLARDRADALDMIANANAVGLATNHAE